MYFVADFEVLGKVESHELKPGGSEIAVSEENKLEYIKYAVLNLLVESKMCYELDAFYQSYVKDNLL